jgi:hypothetical protein
MKSSFALLSENYHHLLVSDFREDRSHHPEEPVDQQWALKSDEILGYLKFHLANLLHLNHG